MPYGIQLLQIQCPWAWHFGSSQEMCSGVARELKSTDLQGWEIPAWPPLKTTQSWSSEIPKLNSFDRFMSPLGMCLQTIRSSRRADRKEASQLPHRYITGSKCPEVSGATIPDNTCVSLQGSANFPTTVLPLIQINTLVALKLRQKTSGAAKKTTDWLIFQKRCLAVWWCVDFVSQNSPASMGGWRILGVEATHLQALKVEKQCSRMGAFF